MPKENKMLEKIKNINILNGEKSGKRKIENLIVFIVILVITIILINIILNEDENKNNPSSGKVLAQTSNNESSTDQTSDLEEKLEDILQNINGVGKVKVLLTYSESSKLQTMYNEDSKVSDTEETDKNGGNRKITENSTKKEVIYKEVSGEKIPVTQSIIQPKIEGAIITAAGASSSSVKASIIQAVEAATGLATHKIQVFQMSN